MKELTQAAVIFFFTLFHNNWCQWDKLIPQQKTKRNCLNWITQFLDFLALVAKHESTESGISCLWLTFEPTSSIENRNLPQVTNNSSASILTELTTILRQVSCHRDSSKTSSQRQWSSQKWDAPKPTRKPGPTPVPEPSPTVPVEAAATSCQARSSPTTSSSRRISGARLKDAPGPRRVRLKSQPHHHPTVPGGPLSRASPTSSRCTGVKSPWRDNVKTDVGGNDGLMGFFWDRPH